MLLGLFVPTSFAEYTPITITVTFNKESVNINEEVQATYSISGGTGEYTFIDYTWMEYVNNQWVNAGFQYPQKKQDTVSFIPTKGTQVGFYMHAEDTNGVLGFASVEPIHIHTEIVIDDAIEPTEINTGLTEGSHCAICNEVIVAQTEIPALYDLSVLQLPVSIKEIGTEAFINIICQAIIIPNGCSAIGEKAFAENDNLIYVHIPASVTEIAYNAFEGCDNVTIFRDED